MKIKIDRREFSKALGEVAPFAPSKTSVAILKNAKITTKGNRMKIEANDTACSMVKYIDTMECDQDGSFLVDAADLNRFVAKTRGETIEVEVDGPAVRVAHANGTAEFSSPSARDYPSFTMDTDGAEETTIDAAQLGRAVRKAASFISTDAFHPQLCGIYAFVSGGAFGFCATDTRRLIHAPVAIPASEDLHWLIMPCVFGALADACAGATEAKVLIAPTHVSYRIGNTIIQTTQAKGEFPNFRRVIPKQWSTECAVGKAEFADALGRVSLFCDEKQCVKMDVSPMAMTLSADNLVCMKSSTENLIHGGCASPITIGANAGSLMDTAKVFDSGDLLMRMTDASRPIVFTQDGCDIEALVMPMVLSQ